MYDSFFFCFLFLGFVIIGDVSTVENDLVCASFVVSQNGMLVCDGSAVCVSGGRDIESG